MADYFSPTVIQQPILIADMTPLEHLVLSLIFDAESDGAAVYFHPSLGPSEAIGLSIDALRAAFDASAGTDSTATAYIAERVAVASTDDTEIEIDFSGTSWEFIFQDIVRRSSTLRYVTAVTSFTCSKMRSDGFGGMAVLITADAIVGKSTNDILEDFLAEKEGDADNGAHVLLRVSEDAVRQQIDQAIEADPALTRLTADAVYDADIHAACLAVVECSDLSKEQGGAFAPRSRPSAKPSNGSLQSADHPDLPNPPGAALPARRPHPPLKGGGHGWLYMKSLNGHSGPRQYLDAQFTFERPDAISKALRSALVGMRVYYAAVEQVRIATGQRDVWAAICLVRYNPRDPEATSSATRIWKNRWGRVSAIAPNISLIC
jgi:hypothetical protein